MSPIKLPYSHSVSTGEQLRKTDQKTKEEFGIDSFTLMETAGIQAANFIGDRETDSSTGLFFCGKGNNGGDALVVARYLAIQKNHRCQIFFPAGTDDLSPDARRNLELLMKLRDEQKPITILTDSDDISGLNPDYVIDGLLGIGLSSDLRSPFDSVVNLINHFGCTVYAMDIPTGLHTDTGELMPDAVKASHTLSFGALKTGFYIGKGPEYSGKIHQFNLSFPDHCRDYFAKLLDTDLESVLPPIERLAEHKYSGRILYVIAGSEGLTGAAMMAAQSGWKTGVGAVVLLSPRGLLEIYEKNLPGIIKSPVGSRSDNSFSENHLEEAEQIINNKKGVLLIGPGLGRHKSTMKFVGELLKKFIGNVVLDADALFNFSSLNKPEQANWIITPHPGEAGHIRGIPFKNQFDRISWVTKFASKKSITVVSKGNPVFLGTANGENYITGYDTRIFARAGFGDVLAGSIAGNLAISGDIELSIIRALIDGYIKADLIRQQSGKPVEPKDLL
jgi:ADP-dependent NAD(P)H-hydrate dehydratase / NAD(P)H-hydrate epimerase